MTQTVRTWNKMNKHRPLFSLQVLPVFCHRVHPSISMAFCTSQGLLSVEEGREAQSLSLGPPHAKHHAKFPRLFADFVIQRGRKSSHSQWIMREQ